MLALLSSMGEDASSANAALFNGSAAKQKVFGRMAICRLLLNLKMNRSEFCG
jgi:hypothetical protein